MENIHHPVLESIFEFFTNGEKIDRLNIMLINKYCLKLSRNVFYKNKAMFYACYSGNLENLKEILTKYNLDPSSESNYAIILASVYGHLDIVEELLKDERVDPLCLNSSAILGACFGNHVGILKRLIKDDRINIDEIFDLIMKYSMNSCSFDVILELSKYKVGNFPKRLISYVCKHGHLDLLKELLLKGVEIDSSNDKTLIVEACTNGHLEIVKELLKDKRVDPSVSKNFPIVISSCCGHLDIVKELLKDERVNPMEISVFDRSAFQEVLKYGYTDILKEFFKSRKIEIHKGTLTVEKIISLCGPYNSDVLQEILNNWHGSEGFDHAIFRVVLDNKFHLLEVLLKDKRADPSEFDNLPLREACLKGMINFVERLLKDERVDPNSGGGIPLNNACSIGHLGIVKLLLKDKRVNPGNTSLASACRSRNLDIVRVLLKDKRIDPSYNDNEPLRISIKFHSTKIIQELLKDIRVLSILKNHTIY